MRFSGLHYTSPLGPATPLGPPPISSENVLGTRCPSTHIAPARGPGRARSPAQVVRPQGVRPAMGGLGQATGFLAHGIAVCARRRPTASSARSAAPRPRSDEALGTGDPWACRRPCGAPLSVARGSAALPTLYISFDSSRAAFGAVTPGRPRVGVEAVPSRPLLNPPPPACHSVCGHHGRTWGHQTL